MKMPLLTVLMLLVFSLFAQAVETDQPFRHNRDEWLREGQLVSVKIKKGSPVQIFVIGREAGTLDLSKMKLSVRQTQPAPAADLSIERKQDHFVVKNLKSLDSVTELIIHAQVKGRDETFTFKLQDNVP